MLVMAGFALVFLIPLILLFYSSSNSDISKLSLSAAKSAVRTIADEASEVYLEGPGASKIITVNYPDGVLNGSISNGLVVLRLNTGGRTQDVVASTFANVTGNLSGRKFSGLQRIILNNQNGLYVNITYA